MIDIPNHLLRHFGISSPGIYTDDVIEMFVSEMQGAIEANQFLAVIGEIGSGKTHLRQRVRRIMSAAAKPPLFVTVHDIYPTRWAPMSSVMSALIEDLSDGAERPKHDPEQRTRQAVRLMYKTAVTEGRKVCIVIDDAHRLPLETLGALKILRERDYLGVAPLCSVILMGWPRLMEKINRRREVKLRVSHIGLVEEAGYMTYPKRVKYLERIYGRALDPDTRMDIAAVNKHPEPMNRAVRDAMQKALFAGYDVVDSRVVTKAPADIMEALGVTYRELGDAVGISKTSAWDWTHGNDEERQEKVRSALNNIKRGRAA